MNRDRARRYARVHSQPTTTPQPGPPPLFAVPTAPSQRGALIPRPASVPRNRGDFSGASIVTPNYSQPGFLAQTLAMLVRRSFYQHRIIVVWSDPERLDPGRIPAASDYEICQDGTHRQPFKSLRQFFSECASFLKRHNIQVVDCTEEALTTRARYERGEVYPGAREWGGGVDAGFKCNIGVRHVTTPWVCGLWDADFTATQDWDRPIVDFMHSGEAHERDYLVPMHVQPAEVPSAADVERFDTWRDSPAISNHRLAIATNRVCGSASYVTQDDVAKYIARFSRPGQRIVEPCGQRARIHFLPAFVRTAEMRAAGGYSMMGCGVDTELDDRWGKRGGVKTSFCDAFILHKAVPPLTDEDWQELRS